MGHDQRRDVEKFRPGVEALLAGAGPAVADGSGRLVGTVHLGRVTKVHLGLNSKADDSEVDAPDIWWPIYGPDRFLASFRASVDKLISGSVLRFGEVAVYFADGLVTHAMLTARFLPGEDDHMRRFLGGGADEPA